MTDETMTTPAAAAETLGATPPAQPAAEVKPAKRRRRAPGEAAGTRAEHDHYDTDPACALGCVRFIASRIVRKDPTIILEPCGGSGPFIVAARSIWPGAKIGAVDIRAEAREQCIAAGANGFVHADALTLPPAAIAQCDLIVSNPPFKEADRLARHFYTHMKDGAVLVFLLSVTFIGSSDRWETKPKEGEPFGLYLDAPLYMMSPIVPRPDFGKGSGPKFEAGLFAWIKGIPEGAEASGCSWDGAIIPSQPVRWERAPRERKPRAPKEG